MKVLLTQFRGQSLLFNVRFSKTSQEFAMILSVHFSHTPCLPFCLFIEDKGTFFHQRPPLWDIAFQWGLFIALNSTTHASLDYLHENFSSGFTFLPLQQR